MPTELALSIFNEFGCNPEDFSPIPDQQRSVEASNSVLDMARNHKLVFEKAWTVPPVDQINANNAWRLRETLKASSGEHQTLPYYGIATDDNHFPRVVVEGREIFIEYFRNEKDGREGRLTRISPGQYYAQFTERQPEIKSAVEKLQTDFLPLDAVVIEDPAEARNIYENGPATSCMTHSASSFGVDADKTPPMAYTGISDFRVFGVRKGDKWVARTVVNLKTRRYGRIYGRHDLAEKALKQNGFNRGYSSDSISGCIAPVIQTVDFDNPNNLSITAVVPYVDNSAGYGFVDPYQNLDRNIFGRGQIRIQLGPSAVTKINGWDLPAVEIRSTHVRRTIALARCDCCNRLYNNDGLKFMKTSFMHTVFPQTNTVRVCYQCRPHAKECLRVKPSTYMPKADMISVNNAFVTKWRYLDEFANHFPILIGNTAHTTETATQLNNRWFPTEELEYDPENRTYHAPTNSGIKFTAKAAGSDTRINLRIPEELRSSFNDYLAILKRHGLELADFEIH